jgi:hypothetical protein
MPTTNSCPAVRDLQLLARAELDGPVAEVLRRHLAECERCAEIVRLFGGTRAGARPVAGPELQAADTPDESGTWRGGLPPAAVAGRPACGVVAAVAPPSRGSGDGTQEVLELLDPPQGPDEMGRLGPYRVFRMLGSGATGVVFHAEDVALRRPVALKVMKPVAGDDDVARQRFLREAQAAAVIDHEHIVLIYQVGEAAGVPYLAMKFLEGESLDDRLKREGQLLVHEVLRIGTEVAQGLAAAHEHGLIPRDIKPANVFLENSGRVKIVDFGLARAASDDLHLTRTGTIVGTPADMSPEQARGLRVDHRSDLFSLGCLLYRLCAGRPRFLADDTPGMLTALSQDQPPPVKTFNAAVPDLLAGLISQLLAKLPEGRPQSAAAVAASLAAMSELVAGARYLGQLPSQRDPAWGGAPRPLWVTVLQMLALAGQGWAAYAWGPLAFQVVCDQLETFRLR